jgi:hypothetical protein
LFLFSVFSVQSVFINGSAKFLKNFADAQLSLRWKLIPACPRWRAPLSRGDRGSKTLEHSAPINKSIRRLLLLLTSFFADILYGHAGIPSAV